VLVLQLQTTNQRREQRLHSLLSSTVDVAELRGVLHRRDDWYHCSLGPVPRHARPPSGDSRLRGSGRQCLPAAARRVTDAATDLS
jgi:hypothetical protein